MDRQHSTQSHHRPVTATITPPYHSDPHIPYAFGSSVPRHLSFRVPLHPIDAEYREPVLASRCLDSGARRFVKSSPINNRFAACLRNYDPTPTRQLPSRAVVQRSKTFVGSSERLRRLREKRKASGSNIATSATQLHAVNSPVNNLSANSSQRDLNETFTVSAAAPVQENISESSTLHLGAVQSELISTTVTDEQHVNDQWPNGASGDAQEQNASALADMFEQSLLVSAEKPCARTYDTVNDNITSVSPDSTSRTPHATEQNNKVEQELLNGLEMENGISKSKGDVNNIMESTISEPTEASNPKNTETSQRIQEILDRTRSSSRKSSNPSATAQTPEQQGSATPPENVSEARLNVQNILNRFKNSPLLVNDSASVE